MVKINASDKIIFENQKKEKYVNKINFVHKSPSKRSSRPEFTDF